MAPLDQPFRERPVVVVSYTVIGYDGYVQESPVRMQPRPKLGAEIALRTQVCRLRLFDAHLRVHSLDLGALGLSARSGAVSLAG